MKKTGRIISGLLAIGLTAFMGGRLHAVEDCAQMPGSVTLEGVGFNRPESIQWDSITNSWYLSNQAFNQTAGDGFISRLNADGSLAELYWATGGGPGLMLGRPTGIRIFQKKLYVADGLFGESSPQNAIAVFDLEDGSLSKVYTLDPHLLNGGQVNDPVVDPRSDSIYVSVFSIVAGLGNTVLKMSLSGNGGDASQLATPASLEFGNRPNGTLIYKKDLIVINADREFIRVDLDSGALEPLGETSLSSVPLEILDGIEREGGNFLFTVNGIATGTPSFLARIRFQPDGTVKEQMLCTLAVGQGGADLGINRDDRVVAIPHLAGNKVTFVRLDEFPEME